MKIHIRTNKSLIVYDRTEKISVSILRDLFTFAVLALCVYVSHGSATWTFISAMMFLVLLFTRAVRMFDEKSVKLNSWAELKDWAEKQERQDAAD